jgi:hypothetical protein
MQESPILYPFFDHALGAIGGTHIPCTLSSADHDLSKNREGILTQNCLAVCSFDLRFTHFLSGWGGSTADLNTFQ